MVSLQIAPTERIVEPLGAATRTLATSRITDAVTAVGSSTAGVDENPKARTAGGPRMSAKDNKAMARVRQIEQ